MANSDTCPRPTTHRRLRLRRALLHQGGLGDRGAYFLHLPLRLFGDLGLYPIVASQYSSSTLHQFSDHIQSLFF